MNRFFHLILMACALIGASFAQAHHSFSATFQEGAKITREGVVTDFSFRNPHILVYFDVTNEDGSVTGWVSEGAAATLMRRRGWGRDSIKPGDYIRVFGDSTHDGSPMTSIDTLDIVNADTGAVVTALMERNRGGQDTGVTKAASMPLTLPDGKPNLTGAWTNHGMANGRPRRPELSLSEAGQAVQARFDLSNDPQVFCDAPGLVRQVGTTPHPIRITQLEDRILFKYEEYGGERTVFFDDRAHLGVKSHLGDSIARYEGNTLVIETRNLLENQTSPEGDTLSDQTTTREVYTRADDDAHGPIVELNMYMADPINLTEQLVMTRQKMSAGDYEFIENDCQPPLRERGKVHPAMNVFVASELPSNNGEADQHCSSLAAQIGQGDKDWSGVMSLGDSLSAPLYTAKGDLLAADLSNLNADAEYLKQVTLVDERGSQIEGEASLYCVVSN